MSKTKILCVLSDTDGVMYYRSSSPHITMQAQFPDECNIELRMLQDGTLPLLDENFLRQFNVFVYNKIIPFSNPELENRFYDICRRHDIKIIYDIDDYFILDSTHLNYHNWKQNNSQKVIENCLSKADLITTTTPIFADILKKYCRRVEVIENGVNFNEQQWISKKTQSDKLRFIWGGGISHMVDIRLMKDSFKKFDKEFLKKTQVLMCGYDLRIRMPDGSMQKDDPKRSQWTFFESIFTNNHKYFFNPEYHEWLKKYDDTDYGYKEEFKDEFFQRVWTRAILLYGEMYNRADVALSPLKNKHSFNLVKSQLKVIEAGAHHMPIIASNYGPYTIDDIEGKKDGKQKGFLIDESIGDWYEKMKWYLNNKEAVKDHAENLYEYVKNNYSLEVLNRKRLDLYNSVKKV